MGCKRRLRLRIVGPDGSCSLEAWLHPRGCMKAKTTHIDVSFRVGCGQLKPLVELGSLRGLKVGCEAQGGCLVLRIDELGLDLKLCPDLGGSEASAGLVCGERVYIKATRRGTLYVGPVTIAA
ncbi:MAG: hypothetical protein ABWW70_04995 [Thermoproteota archaeon]